MSQADEIRERLRIRGREPDNYFSLDEPLYVRVRQFSAEGRVYDTELKLDSTGGMSVNRGKYSLPSDVLYPAWPDHRVATCAVQSIPKETTSGDKKRFKFAPKHDPTSFEWNHDVIENYSHTLIQALKEPGFDRHVRPSSIVEKFFRMKLANVLQLIPT